MNRGTDVNYVRAGFRGIHAPETITRHLSQGLRRFEGTIGKLQKRPTQFARARRKPCDRRLCLSRLDGLIPLYQSLQHLIFLFQRSQFGFGAVFRGVEATVERIAGGNVSARRAPRCPLPILRQKRLDLARLKQAELRFALA